MHLQFLKKSGTFASLASTATLQSLLPYVHKPTSNNQPRRKSLDAPIDKNTFIKPIKQCFVKNPRLMPMTRLMLTLVAGWAGQGGAIETTTGILAKHLSRSRRQVFRYLRDAMEEGYLSYCKTKGRSGLYTGIRIWLNFGAIRFTRFQKKETQSSRKLVNPDMTSVSDTNTKQLINSRKRGTPGGDALHQDDDLWERLLNFGSKLGYIEKKVPEAVSMIQLNGTDDNGGIG